VADLTPVNGLLDAHLLYCGVRAAFLNCVYSSRKAKQPGPVSVLGEMRHLLLRPFASRSCCGKISVDRLCLRRTEQQSRRSYVAMSTGWRHTRGAGCV